MNDKDFNLDEIRQAIKNSPQDSGVYIGSDSKVYAGEECQMVAYVTVIILHYGSSKGAKIFKSHRTSKYFGEIRQRLMDEVTEAITAGMAIADVIEDRKFKIHLDINRDERYKSAKLVKEATGYVLGTLGFEPKLKPDSFAASSVADRYCVKDAKKNQSSAKKKKIK